MIKKFTIMAILLCLAVPALAHLTPDAPMYKDLPTIDTTTDVPFGKNPVNTVLPYVEYKPTTHCLVYDFSSSALSLREHGVYDNVVEGRIQQNSGFIGYKVCLDLNEGKTWAGSKNSGTTYSSKVNNCRNWVYDFSVEIRLLSDPIDVYDIRELDTSRLDEKDQNITLGEVDMRDGSKGRYLIYDQRVGQHAYVPDDPNFVLSDEAKGDPRLAEQERTMDRYRNAALGRRVMVDDYARNVFFGYQIDDKTVLVIESQFLPTEDLINITKSINVSIIEGKDTRYTIDEGNMLFDQAKYAEAVLAYDNLLQSDLTFDIIDKKGISLYNIGKFNETYEWFNLYAPTSKLAWNIYGEVLKARNLTDQANYAFALAVPDATR